MGTLNIEGIGRVKVSDNFMSLSPDEQQQTANDIARQINEARAKRVAQEMHMQTFEVTSPDGAKYRVQAPDGASQQEVLDRVRAIHVSSDIQKQPDYGSMSAGQVAKSALANAPASAAQFGSDIYQAVAHPIETGTNIGNIGKGVMQKLGIMEGEDATPYADAVGKFLVDRYGSGAAIKKTLATDPVGVAADIATVLSGGELAAARAPGIAGTLGRAAGTVGRAIDPLTLAGKGVVAAGKAATVPLGVTTGVGRDAIQLAAEAGAKGGSAAQAFRNPEGIVEDATAAVSEMRAQRGQEYRTAMAKVGGDKTVLDFADIDKAVNNSVKTYKGVSISPSTAKVQGAIRDAVDEWKALDPAEYHTAEGLDALKQKIGDIRDATQFGSPERLAADKVYQATRATIAKQVPEYGKIMNAYETASAAIKEMEKTLSANPKASVDTQMRKLLSALRDNVNTNFGRRKELVALLTRYGAKNLLYKLAGKSLSSYEPRGLARGAAPLELAGGLGGALLGHPAIGGAAMATLAASSPALVGGAAFGAGAASRLPLRALGRLGFQSGRISNGQ